MPREYSPYCVIETTFILADPRYGGLSATAKVMYLALWARAFHERRETLPEWYLTEDAGKDAGLGRKTAGRCLKELEKKLLIERSESGNIKVTGVRNKGNVRWKDGGKTRPQTKGKPLSKKRREEKRREKKRKEENTTSCSVPEELRALELYKVDEELCKKWDELMRAWEQGYPYLNIAECVAKAHAWEVSHPTRRKKDRGKFLTNWLNRADEDRAKRPDKTNPQDPKMFEINPEDLPL